MIECSFTDLLEKIVDNRGRTCPTADSGLPLIATNCIKSDHLYPVFENVRYVDEETVGKWFRGHPKPNDIIFVCKGSPGRVAMVPDPVPFCIAQDMVALRADQRVIRPRYLYYALKSPSVQAKINNMHVGSMIPHFKKGDFGKLRFSIHEDIGEQRAIADVLGALDDKIAANTTLIATADELSLTVFLSMSLSVSQLVPLSETAKFVNGKAFTKNASGTGRVVIRIAELNSGIGGSTVYNDIDVDEQHLARQGDLLFAWSGSLTLHRWFRPEGIVNQHIFKVIPNDGYPHWLVHELLRRKLDDFKSIAADKATTMGHIQRKHLDEAVAVPPLEEIRKHDELMSTLWERTLGAEVENLKLAATRDALLPQLMAGKLRVRDAESVLARVGV
ncbi:restriction endonuclease subunit S [Arthrobacter sp. CG_A4]|uniref:restriction endonuclease subunit S n=1 Tax=Arthrobacter sp. CG_A4 TaxID=3071706 RepID=UPI002E107AAC